MKEGCGSDVVRECPSCSTLTLSFADKCQANGHEMAILAPLLAQVTGTTSNWLRQDRRWHRMPRSRSEPGQRLVSQSRGRLRLAASRRQCQHRPDPINNGARWSP